MLAGVITNAVFGFVRSAVLMAAVHTGRPVGGYDLGSIGAYVWLTQGMLGAVQMMGPPPELSDRIKSGDVAVDFIRPVDLQISGLAMDLGRAACSVLPRGIPGLLIGSLTFGLTMPSTSAPYLLGAVSIVLAVALSFLTQFAVALTGFWVIEARGIRTLYVVGGTFLAGLYVPVHIFPAWLRRVATATPFPSILQAPVDVLSGRIVGWQATGAVVAQACWVIGFLVLGQLMLRAGRRKLEVQGG